MYTPSLRVAVPALCIVALFLSAEPRGTRIAFAPEAGAKVRKSIAHDSQMELERVVMSINGEEREMGDIEQTGESKEQYVFLDEYTRVEKGELLALSRTYETATDTQSQSIKTPRGEQSGEQESKTELLGKTVAFTFDAKSDEWKRAFVGDDGDDALLPGLQPKYELLELLPEDEVAEGAEWELGTAAAAAILFPGGDLSMRTDEDTDDEIAARKSMRDALEAKGKATFKGLREEDGVSIAEIEFEVEAGSKWEFERDGGASEQRSLELKLKGELAWNMSKHRAEHLAVEHEGRLQMQSKRTMSRGDESFDISNETVLALRGKGECTFAAAE